LKKILVIQTASIGDAILATPLIEQLHLLFPDARIDFLVKKGQERLFDNHPFLHEILMWDKSNRKYRNLFSFAKKIRKNRYDLVINVQRFASTGILTALSGAAKRYGFSKNPFSFTYTRSVEHPIGEGIHEVERNHTLIADLDHAPGNLKPKLYPSPEDFQKAEQIAKTGYYTISPGSLWFTKKFPPVKWIEFLKQVVGDNDILFLGSKEDHSTCQQIIEESGYKKAINLAGTLSFLESAALMKNARMNFTNDSAPMHLASAVNAPVTAIFCSTIPSFGFGPLSDISFIVETEEKLNCKPCGLHGFRNCPEKHFKCATTIQPRQLLKVIDNKMG
jgi:heptosyltransferase-2